MRIFDEQDRLLDSYDETKGRLVEDRLLICHHAAVEAVKEEGHWEVVAEYPNGGTDVEWVVDVPGVQASDEWDEYENIWRYVLFTEDELAVEQEKQSKAEKESNLQKRIQALLDTAVTWDELAAAIAEGVNSV